MVSSNFERLLFDLYERDGDSVKRLMEEFSEGDMTLSEEALKSARELFTSYRLDEDATLEMIRKVYRESSYLLDPHTAIGLAAARASIGDKSIPMVCLATAHPAKFPEAIEKASDETTFAKANLPDSMSNLFDREERYEVLANDISDVQEFIAQKIA